MLHEVEDEYVYISVQREQTTEDVVNCHIKSVSFIKGLSVYIICKELFFFFFYTISNGTLEDREGKLFPFSFCFIIQS